MKKLHYIFVMFLLLMCGISNALADVNEEITFTNYTDEEIYVDLAIIDDSGWNFYDLYVSEDGSSIANFWADTFFASYSACAYGQISGKYYGCIEGNIRDSFNFIYFDNTGFPYKSDPPDQDADLYFFDNPNDTPDVVVIDNDGYYDGSGGGCFMGSISIFD